MAGHDKLTPEGRRFFAQIEELKKLQVRVGIQQSDGKAKTRDKDGNVIDSDVDLLDVAMWNELGTAHSPARPFLRQSVDGNKATIEAVCKAQVQTLTKGGTAQQVLNAVGVMQKGLVQDTISKSKAWAEPNADRTVKKKGSDQPLVDSGKMAQSVNYVIKPKGGGE
jgi:hypothetical protein